MSTHMHTHKIRIQLCYFVSETRCSSVCQTALMSTYSYVFSSLSFFLPPPCQIYTINSSTDTHIHPLCGKGFFCVNG